MDGESMIKNINEKILKEKSLDPNNYEITDMSDEENDSSLITSPQYEWITKDQSLSKVLKLSKNDEMLKYKKKKFEIEESKEGKELFCNKKKVPKWAEDKQEIARIAIGQKKLKKQDKVFGVLLKYNNISLTSIFNQRKEDYEVRGESVFWNTPKSIQDKRSSFITNRTTSRAIRQYQQIYENIY